MANTNTRQNNRKPVTLKIKFKSGTLDEFIERYAVDISQGGIFIRTKDPLEVGTILKFEFLLKDSTPLIAGDGTVVWNREYDPARTGIPPGMGVRFDKLSPDSQGTLDTVLLRKSGNAPVAGTVDDSPFGVDDESDDYDPSGDFVDSPTRVAPADLVASLRRDYDGDGDKTPLPQPMPFQGDNDDFDENAFSESTRVVGVDELLANAGGADVFNTPSPPQAQAPVASVELDEYEDPFGDLNEDGAQQNSGSGLDLQSEFESPGSSPAAESSPAAIHIPANREPEEKVQVRDNLVENNAAAPPAKVEANVEVADEAVSKA
ncbi:MAG: TIGR02266 family protein, partial [Kofleriaceae bacterium]|nr:TIGR02266 family protein [Kofleriaceae bacterium]